MSVSVLLLLNLACQTSSPDSVVSDLSIRLRWYQGYETDSWARAEQGLWWSLSQLGARPPGDGSALRVEEVFADRVDFVLDFRNMGWNPSAHAMMEEVVAVIADGTVKLNITGRYELACIGEAHAALDSRTTTGALVTVFED